MTWYVPAAAAAGLYHIFDVSVNAGPVDGLASPPLRAVDALVAIVQPSQCLSPKALWDDKTRSVHDQIAIQSQHRTYAPVRAQHGLQVMTMVGETCQYGVLERDVLRVAGCCGAYFLQCLVLQWSEPRAVLAHSEQAGRHGLVQDVSIIFCYLVFSYSILYRSTAEGIRYAVIRTLLPAGVEAVHAHFLAHSLQARVLDLTETFAAELAPEVARLVGSEVAEAVESAVEDKVQKLFEEHTELQEIVEEKLRGHPRISDMR